MQDILFLAHRIPFPPDKGDKIRSWHFLSHLAKHRTVHLGCFVDTDIDMSEHAPVLRKLCDETYFAPMNSWRAGAHSLAGLCRSRPLTVSHFQHGGLGAWVRTLLAERPIGCIFVFSSAMAQYAMDNIPRHTRRVIDFVDVDSDKWRQYAETRPWPESWLYRREARTLMAFDREVAAKFDAAIFVSSAEADLFSRAAPELADKIFSISNGVDFNYFAPDASYPNPYPPGRQVLAFTGAMDYWPNVDAAIWFATEILPHIRSRSPNTWFYVVGANPGPKVRALDDHPGVHVTGRVADVRPYIAHAAAIVSPLRIARGLQNKVLEGMAMARPVIATPESCGGLKASIRDAVLLASDVKSFTHQALDVLRSDRREAIGHSARAAVMSFHDWQESLASLDAVLKGGATSASFSVSKVAS